MIRVISKYRPMHYVICFSISTLNRFMKKYGIHRFDRTVQVQDVDRTVAEELRGAGTNAGVRTMHENIRSRHGLRVSR